MFLQINLRTNIKQFFYIFYLHELFWRALFQPNESQSILSRPIKEYEGSEDNKISQKSKRTRTGQ